jgi:hypothetical protein
MNYIYIIINNNNSFIVKALYNTIGHFNINTQWNLDVSRFLIVFKMSRLFFWCNTCFMTDACIPILIVDGFVDGGGV